MQVRKSKKIRNVLSSVSYVYFWSSINLVTVLVAAIYASLTSSSLRSVSSVSCLNDVPKIN